MNKKTIAIIGAGNMGCAVADGILSSGTLGAESLVLTRRSTDKLEKYKNLGCTVTSDNELAASMAEVIIIGVKPQITGGVFSEIAAAAAGKLVVSIAAGVTIEAIEKAMPGCRAVRVMPNTPLMVGAGVNVMCRGESVGDEDFDFVKEIFEKTGFAPVCPENLINPVTALTSSSVAYFARIIGDMCRWAEQNGFQNYEKEALIRMVADTAIGTARLINERHMEPDALVKAVTSPNGTTERANKVFDEKKLDDIIFEAMSACRDRADELSRG